MTVNYEILQGIILGLIFCAAFLAAVCAWKIYVCLRKKEYNNGKG